MAFPTRDYLKVIQSEKKQPDSTFAAAFLEILSRLDHMERAIGELKDEADEMEE